MQHMFYCQLIYIPLIGKYLKVNYWGLLLLIFISVVRNKAPFYVVDFYCLCIKLRLIC
jgi:hypothetical protein